MSRRAIGVAVLCVARLCAVVVAKAGGLRVAGTVVFPPVLDMPRGDECLTSISIQLASGVTPSPVSIDSVGATAVVFADCAGDHIGDFVAILIAPSSDLGTHGGRLAGAGPDTRPIWPVPVR
jgi:hypothetical protein